MTFFFSFVKNVGSTIKYRQLRFLSTKTIIMASSNSYKVYIPGDTVPTAETKITLADLVTVSPISK